MIGSLQTNKLKKNRSVKIDVNIFLKTVIAIVLLSLLTSCTLGYLPPIPRQRSLPEATITLEHSSGLILLTENIADENDKQKLELSITIQNTPEADWLAVQWFAPNNKPVASASQWLEAQKQPQELVFELEPTEASTFATGDWRAIVSYQESILRQFSIVVNPPALLEPETSEPENLDSESSNSENPNSENPNPENPTDEQKPPAESD